MLPKSKVDLYAAIRRDAVRAARERHTVKRIFERLQDEHRADEISYQMVRAGGGR
ncbi:hypothetical protein [Streptomyces griseocarneus]|uniref:hypothetical protein n=1 Tax=Streptomyces griseocarneus TaxID=51201 RepID=UPI00167D5104|nr:hypothetical protein [Streptomyces griseocarneus]MBZ6478103.1 hypothetical protein [Streptomyces griseocarneus]GHG83724.1 hypothetical protein GCM10018779_66970 [Streptomyces griseocarneus]